jgi:hypothetical protein
MEELFANQVFDRAIITDDLFDLLCHREAGGGSEWKTVDIGGFRFTLIYVRSRGLRHDQTTLVKLGIKNPDAARYYEFDPSPDFPYVRYRPEQAYQGRDLETRKRVKFSPFYNYIDANPKSESLEITLHGKDGISQRFHISPNISPFCDNHFLVWPEPENCLGLKQVYHESLFYWIDDLFSRLDSHYSLFFSAIGAGNSLDTLHFQVLPLPFPAFDYLGRRYGDTGSGLIETSAEIWPLPGIFARYNSGTKTVVLVELDRYIRGWLSRDKARTFNLIFRKKNAGIREAFFIFRKKGIARLPGVPNEFAASEAGGNIIIESRTDYANFPSITDRFELVNEAGQPVYRADRQDLVKTPGQS